MRTPFQSPSLFPALVTDASAAPAYPWAEAWDTGGGVLAPKVGGRRGTASSPGVDVLGGGFAVNNPVWCRSAEGRAGLTWELFPLGSGGSSVLSYRDSAGGFAWGGTRLTLHKIVPKASYLVAADVGVIFGATGDMFFGINVCDEGAVIATAKLRAAPADVNGVSGNKTSVSLTELLGPTDYDATGATANLEFSVYMRTISGTPPSAAVNRWSLLKVDSIL